LPESPRWLAVRGRPAEAEAAMALIERETEKATGQPLPPPMPVVATLQKPASLSDLFGPLHHRLAYHVHHVTPEAFMDRVLSVSYVSAASDAEREGVRAEVDELLATDPELRDRDEIVMPYRTDVFWTQRRTEGPDQAPATSV